MSVEVLLSETEIHVALSAAMIRIQNATKAEYKHKYPSEHLTPDYVFKLNWLGASAEIAVAKWLNIENFIPSVDSYKEDPDIDPNWEVKHTELDTGHLIIQENDRDSDRAVLVTGSNPFVIRGWLPVSYCKDDLYLKTTSRNTAYWVPQSELVKVNDTGA